jgi:hypothetical protein
VHLIRISPPAVLPVSLAEVKAGARLDDEDDAFVAALIRTAVERCDGPDGEVQRALITQTWELRLDCFPGYWPAHGPYWPAYRPYRLGFIPYIEIPLPPLQSVDSIAYVSGGGQVTMAASEYVVSGVDDRHKARVRPVMAWPGTDDVMDAVTISFTAGYGSSWNDVPESIRMGITAMVRDLFDSCESGLPEKLLAPYRVDLGFA